MIDDEATVRRMAKAEGPIVFRADGWKRELSPNPLIKRFVEECEAMRKVDPDADGLPGYTLRSGSRISTSPAQISTAPATSNAPSASP